MNDTDTLLAILASLLPAPVPDQEKLLNTLVESNGDVEEAARRLSRSVRSKQTGTSKRRRTAGLDDWLSHSSASLSKIARKDRDTVDKIAHDGSSPAKSVNLMSILRQPPPMTPTLPRIPPMTLSNPSLVAQHTPCTLHLSVLPPELACRLFYTMIDASQSWQRNTWWLFDRLVQSPHRTSFFARKTDGVDNDESWQEAAQYWYNGRKTAPPSVFPSAMEEACEIIERVVNAEMKKRNRFPLEWAGSGTEGQTWRANVAASNCYEGAKEGVGFHSDQMTYLGPCPTIASLSLGTKRNFSLREVVPLDQANTRRAQTLYIPLAHNSLIIMHPPTQEKFKHAIQPQPTLDLFKPPFPRTPSSPITSSNIRINITFRFYRPDFAPSKTPRCHCGVPTVLRADMKGRQGKNGEMVRYWWSCYAGAQNEGKGCNYWKVMDIEAEGRGPIVGSVGVRVND